MIYLALKMLLGDRSRYAGLIFGITFTSFLVTFAASYFAGFMTRGFTLIQQNGADKIWVMDPAVTSVEQTTNLPSDAFDRVRNVPGVGSAAPLVLGTAEVRYPDGRFQPFDVIGVDDTTLGGVPSPLGISPIVLWSPDSVIVDPGGTDDKLNTPGGAADIWPHDGPHLDAPTRLLEAGDVVLANDHRVVVVGRSQGLPRYPPRPLMYTTISNAMRILLPERRRITFILATPAPGVAPDTLTTRIQSATGLRSRTAAEFKADTVDWYLNNSEDVGDIGAMLTLAMSVGFGVTGVMLYMFTQDNLRHYAVLSAMGTTRLVLLRMVFAQAGFCALVGTGLGLGLCGIIGEVISRYDFPFRMMWVTPIVSTILVFIVSVVAAALSARPVWKLQPTLVLAGR